MTESPAQKQRRLGQYMTTPEVAHLMCQAIKTPRKDWVVFDPSCGDGVLLEAAAQHLILSGVCKSRIKLRGFDVDDDMISRARHRLNALPGDDFGSLELHCCDTIEELRSGIFSLRSSVLSDVNVIIGNPPYGKGLEVTFFEECNLHFSGCAELVFLLPLSFIDQISGVDYEILKGRPLKVTTGHVIVRHFCGDKFFKKSQKVRLDAVQGFSALSGVKLYALGEGTPAQDKHIMAKKPYSSDVAVAGWLPCLRTGDIKQYSYTMGRLWVNYGPHLAHPKEIDRFIGPRLLVRRVPIWSGKYLGSCYIEEIALCAGDVLTVRHKNSDTELLKGLCVFLNSPEAANHIVEMRPSVGHRDSFPKISAKDLVGLFRSRLPSEDDLRRLAKEFPL